MRGARLLAVLAAVASLGAASDPAERLADPAQEQRARALFQDIRCVVCQNESIDDSEADLAADLRRLVRQEIAQGETNEQVRASLVRRYGEFILLKPRFSIGNAVLWLTPFLIVIGGAAVFLVRRRTITTGGDDLNAAEETRLRNLAGEPLDGAGNRRA